MSTYEWGVRVIDIPGVCHQVSTGVVFSIGPGGMQPCQPEQLSPAKDEYLAGFKAELEEASSAEAIDAVWRAYDPVATNPGLANLMKHLAQHAAVQFDRAASSEGEPSDG